MPIYEFICNDCNKEYDDLCDYDETDKYEDVICPHCDSGDKKKLLSACKHAFEGDAVIGTDKWNSDSTGHDYRFKYNLPKVINQRKHAEINSHMGKDPYGNADMSRNDIEMDTGIHDAPEGPTVMTDYSE
jgi:putative FmdB family regulatory protein